MSQASRSELTTDSLMPRLVINSSKSMGYISLIAIYPTGSERRSLSSTPSSDPLRM